jgi:hypothetical protein
MLFINSVIADDALLIMDDDAFSFSRDLNPGKSGRLIHIGDKFEIKSLKSCIE